MDTVDICICTFRRDSVVAAIRSAAAQALPEGHALRIIVADNDEAPSALSRVRAVETPVPVHYIHAPARNISVARNACLDAARDGWIAFLDDDETAPPDWIARLLACAEAQGADAVFGPARAIYPASAPDWIRLNDFHSNLPQRRGGVVETGHSCNVLFRLAGTPAAAFRFDPALGRSGGEDTDFFFRLHRAGLTLAICDKAEVTEEVSPHRLKLSWLAERRMAEGQHYATSAGKARPVLLANALAKAALCTAAALPHATNPPRLAYWGLRAAFHLGVVRGVVKPAKRDAYGS